MHESITVNCAGMNTQQKTKIMRVAASASQLKLFFTDFPYPEHEYDLYIISQKLLQSDDELRTRLEYRFIPVIVYGRKLSFSIAAASACSDAVHEDCTSSELLYRIMKQRRRNYITITGRKVMIFPKSISCINKHVSISSREKTLLQIFSYFPPGTVLTREYLSRSLGIAYRERSRVLDMNISNLRKKLALAISNIDSRAVIQAVQGEGYALADEQIVRKKES